MGLFTSDQFLISLIGDTQRRNGALSYLALTILLIFCALKMDYYFVLRLLKYAIIMGFVLCVYGLMQSSGNDFVSWNNPYNPMILTVGNPNFAASLLGLISLISIFLLMITSISKLFRVSLIVLVVLCIYLILSSESRQGLILMFFSISFYFMLYTYFNKKRYFLMVGTSLVIIQFLSVLGMLQIGPLTRLLYKESVTVRGYYWRAAWEMFKDHPLFGVGLDRYGAFFKEYRDPGYSLRYGFDITSSNAHNLILQFLSTGGIFLGLSYLSILMLIFVVGIKNIKTTEGDARKINLLLLACWVGFQAQSTISIDNIGISVWGWVLGGCILGISLNKLDQSKISFSSKANFVRDKKIDLIQPFVSSLVLVPILIIVINLHQMETDTRRANLYADPNVPENSSFLQSAANEVLLNPLSDPFYKFQAARSIGDMGNLEFSYSVISDLHKKDLRNLDFLNWLVWYERIKSNPSNEELYRKKIAKLDPWNASNYLELGKLYKKQGDNLKMNLMLERILRFAANSPIASEARNELK
jgi:O-antigen ligase